MLSFGFVSPSRQFLLATLLTLMACSSGNPAGSIEAPPEPKTSVSPTPPSDTPDPSKAPAETPPPAGTPPLRETNDPAVTTALQAAGLDLATLPADLDELTDPSRREELMAVMRAFTIALGTKCDGCHKTNGDELDPSAQTKKKSVAKKMYSEFVQALQRRDGTPIFCDTCHQGKMEFLLREDKGALRTWMRRSFVEKLRRKDQRALSCTTCHGDPFDKNFLDGW